MDPVVINPGDTAGVVDEVAEPKTQVATDPASAPPIEVTSTVQASSILAAPSDGRPLEVKMKHRGLKVFLVAVVTYFVVVGFGIVIVRLMQT